MRTNITWPRCAVSTKAMSYPLDDEREITLRLY